MSRPATRPAAGKLGSKPPRRTAAEKKLASARRAAIKRAERAANLAASQELRRVQQATTHHRTPEQDEVFLARLLAGELPMVAADRAGYSRRAIYDWRERDIEFRALWQTAQPVAPAPSTRRTNQACRSSRQDDVFFAALEIGLPIMDACREAGYHMRSVYRYRNQHDDFAERWDEAQAIAVMRLEREADRRAVEGFTEPVFQRGALVGEIRRYSDMLLMFRLKALAPEKYRERYEHSGSGGGPIIVQTGVPRHTEISHVELPAQRPLIDVTPE